MVKHGKKTLIVKTFDWKDLGIKKLRKNSNYKTIQKNNDNFIYWIKQILGELYTLNSDEKYNACCVYMNDYNVEKLNQHMEPMTWLAYSPSICNSLKNNEYGVDLSNIFENLD